MSVDRSAALADGLSAAGIQTTQRQHDALLKYLNLLQRWNRVYNLTAVRDPDQMIPLHILDSLAVLPWLHGPRLLDVGSGAGLPGIPLAVMTPDLDYTLLDASAKKARFMRQTVIELGLNNVEVVNERLENYRPSRPFDTLLSRAFSSLRAFVEGTAALAAPQAHWLAMKGKLPVDEIRALPAGYVVEDSPQLRVPGVTGERHLIVISRLAGEHG